jgi:uncharacterized membrane protein
MNAAEYLAYKHHRRDINGMFWAGILMFLLGVLAGTMLGITVTMQVLA